MFRSILFQRWGKFHTQREGKSASEGSLKLFFFFFCLWPKVKGANSQSSIVNITEVLSVCVCGGGNIYIYIKI